MSDVTTENNELFDKFMLSFKDEIKVMFLDFIKQNLNRDDDVVDKKKRGRPKKNTDVDNSKTINDQPKKRGRGRPKKDQIEQLKVTVVNDTDEDSPVNEEKKRGRPPSEEKEVDKLVFTADKEEDEEEIDVIRIEINGTVYLRDSSNRLYSIDTQDYVGTHCIQTDMILHYDSQTEMINVVVA